MTTKTDFDKVFKGIDWTRNDRRYWKDVLSKVQHNFSPRYILQLAQKGNAMTAKIKFDDFIKTIDWECKDKKYWKDIFCKVQNMYDPRYVIEDSWYSFTRRNEWPFKVVNYVKQKTPDTTLKFQDVCGVLVANKVGKDEKGGMHLDVYVRSPRGTVYKKVTSYACDFGDIVRRIRYEKRGNFHQYNLSLRIENEEAVCSN